MRAVIAVVIEAVETVKAVEMVKRKVGMVEMVEGEVAMWEAGGERVKGEGEAGAGSDLTCSDDFGVVHVRNISRRSS